MSDSICDFDPNRHSLLSTNAKLTKNEQLDGLAKLCPRLRRHVAHLGAIVIAGLTMAPHRRGGAGNVCENATPGCILGCVLWFGGRRVTQGVRDAAIRITRFFAKAPEAFRAQLVAEVLRHIRYAERRHAEPVVRPNTASDLDYRWLAERFPNVRFYDYTAVRGRVRAMLAGDWPSNYHLTFSAKETTPRAEIREFLEAGANVAIVFDVAYRPNGTYPVVEDLPARVEIDGAEFDVVDGDIHDVRLPEFDGRGRVIGLRLKGTNASKAEARRLGFAWSVDPDSPRLLSVGAPSLSAKFAAQETITEHHAVLAAC